MGKHVLPSSLRKLSARFSSSRAVGLRASPTHLPWEPLSRAAHGAAACFIGASKRGVRVQARSRSPARITDVNSLAHHKHAFGCWLRSAGPAHTAAEGTTEGHGCQALDRRGESFRSWLSWWVTLRLLILTSVVLHLRSLLVGSRVHGESMVMCGLAGSPHCPHCPHSCGGRVSSPGAVFCLS